MAEVTEYGHLSRGALNIGRVKKEGSVTTAEGSFHNGLSHLMGAVDWDSGVVTAAFVYGPFGEVVATVGAEEDEHLRRFNGKEADLESGLSYYGFRYYDSKSLSWTQADPLFVFVPDLGLDQPRLMTLYAFSLNNPIRYMDPDGRAPKDDKKERKKNPEDDDDEEKDIEANVDPESDLGNLPQDAQDEVVGAMLETVHEKMRNASPGSFGDATASVDNNTGPATNPRNSKHKLRANIVSSKNTKAIKARLKKQGFRGAELRKQLKLVVNKLKQGRAGATSRGGRKGGRKTVEVFVNGDGNFSNPRQAGRQLGAVTAHEFGHAMGVKHVNANGPNDLASSPVVTDSQFGSKASLIIRQGL